MDKKKAEKQNRKLGKKLLFIFIPVILLFAFIFISSSTVLNSSKGLSTVNSSIQFHDTVCKTIYRHNGTVQPLGCSPNTLYNDGADGLQFLLGVGNATQGYGGWGIPINITLCNSTVNSSGSWCGAPVAGESELFVPFSGCGLTSGSGTYFSNSVSSVGNWTISKTFTSTCNGQSTNVTRLEYNNTAINFSANSFTTATLQNTDQIQINWTVVLSGS